MWSLGCLLYMMLTVRLPFPLPKNNRGSAMNVNYLDLDLEIEGTSPNCRNLIRRLLFEAPNMRPTIEEVLSHPFLTEEDI